MQVQGKNLLNILVAEGEVQYLCRLNLILILCGIVGLTLPPRIAIDFSYNFIG